MEKDKTIERIYNVAKMSIEERRAHYIELGNQIIENRYLSQWQNCVDIRLNDLYGGIELGYALAAILLLNDENMSLKYVAALVNKQDNSGTSFSMEMSIIRSFCRRGKDFVEFLNATN